MSLVEKGDYVLGTKYRDGDPYDGYAVGFYDGCFDHFGQTRHLVVDGEGKQFRANGFRRVERISSQLGEWIVTNQRAIERRTQLSPINMWRYKYGGEAARQALSGEIDYIPKDPYDVFGPRRDGVLAQAPVGR